MADSEKRENIKQQIGLNNNQPQQQHMRDNGNTQSHHSSPSRRFEFGGDGQQIHGGECADAVDEVLRLQRTSVVHVKSTAHTNIYTSTRVVVSKESGC